MTSAASLPVSGRAFDFLCAVLRGQTICWPDDVGAEFADVFLETSYRHGVELLVLQCLEQADQTTTWPAALYQRLHQARFQAVALEMLQRRALTTVLDALAKHGVDALLMKGTPLAYSHYAFPELRPRGDTDILIPAKTFSAVTNILEDLGYVFANAVSGKFVSYQSTCYKPLTDSVNHILDIHWRVNNAEIFAQALHYDELLQQAVAVPALGVQARALGPAHALLLACMHRVGHRVTGDSERLIWFYDMDRLLTQMNEAELERFNKLLIAKDMMAVCRDGLYKAQQLLGTPLPEQLGATLSSTADVTGTAALLRAGTLKTFYLNFNALPGWSEKTDFLRELFFPSSDYMLRKYKVRSRSWLPLLYLLRAVSGIKKRLTP